MIYRGLGSGIVRALREGVTIDFDNEETANQFKVTVWKKVATSEDKVASSKERLSREEMQERVLAVCSDWISLDEIAKAVNRDKAYLRNKILPLLAENLDMMYATPNHPKQKYRRRQ